MEKKSYTNSELKCHVEGIQSMGGGEFDSTHVEGVVTINGDIITNKMHIEGMTTAKGNVHASKLHIEGVTNITGDIVTENAKIGGVVNLSGNIKAGALDVQGIIHCKGDKVEAESMTCEGLLALDGEISADTIKAEGIIRANEIYGDKIIIKSISSEPYRMLVSGLKSLVGLSEEDKDRVSKIGLIEATTVELKNVKVKEINGQNVIIGEHCFVSKVDCSGTLTVSKTATIEEITGEYEFKEID